MKIEGFSPSTYDYSMFPSPFAEKKKKKTNLFPLNCLSTLIEYPLTFYVGTTFGLLPHVIHHSTASHSQGTIATVRSQK